jgi:hypothetical protein
MLHKDFILFVLGQFEGIQQIRGYIPCKGGNYTGGPGWETKTPFGASGVTIGTGFDLGQQNAAVLAKLGLDEGLRAKLTPYLGLKTGAALKKLSGLPLLLSKGEADALDDAVHDLYINETAAMFGKDRFLSAPKQAQAVAVSLHYQFGTPEREASPGLGKAWQAMREGRWAEAADALRNRKGWSASHQQYMDRRGLEAALLDKITGA